MAVFSGLVTFIRILRYIHSSPPPLKLQSTSIKLTMFRSLIYLIALGQHSLAQSYGVGSSISPLGFDSTFDSAAPEDPTTSMIFVEPDTSLTCPIQPFQSYIFSQNPPVVYVASFVSDDEARHLIQQRFVCPESR